MTTLANSTTDPTADITRLATRRPHPGVSIVLPMQVAGPQTAQNAIVLKNALTEATTQLRDQGLEDSAIETLLEPATSLIDDHDFWQHQARALALYLEAGEPATALAVPLDVRQRVVVASRFHTAPLLPLLGSGETFLVLTATAHDARLYRATRTSLTPLPVEGMPSADDSDGTENDYEAPAQASPPLRPNTGSANISHAQVYGDAPPEWRDSRRDDHALQITRALASATASTSVPIVLVAGADLLGRLRPSGAFAADLEANPDAMSEDELHDRALTAVLPTLDAAQATAVDELAQLTGRGDARVAHDRAAVLAAATSGRIDGLFVTATELDDPAADFADILAGTLEARGRVHVVSPDDAPAGLVATLRY